MKARLVTALLQPRFDLRSSAVYEHELYAECCKQVKIMRQVVKTPVGDEVPAERNHENLAAERVYVRRDRLEPVNEAVLTGKPWAARWRINGSASVDDFPLFFSDRNEVLLLSFARARFELELRGYYARSRVTKSATARQSKDIVDI